MGISPGLTHDTKRRLRQIDPHFVARWNRRTEHWEIWYESDGRIPYMVTPVQGEYQEYRPIDGRTFDKLRHILWYNQRIKQHLREMEEADELAAQAADEREAQAYRDMAGEHRRVVQMFGREIGALPGKSKIPYSPGFGKGLLNASGS